MKRTSSRVICLSIGVAASAALTPLPARAQMDWLTPHLENQRWSNLREHQQRMRERDPTEKPAASTKRNPPAPRPSNATRPESAQAAAKRLEPEYRLRVRRDGKASADAWLKAEAFAAGRQAGREERRRQAGR